MTCLPAILLPELYTVVAKGKLQIMDSYVPSSYMNESICNFRGLHGFS